MAGSGGFGFVVNPIVLLFLLLLGVAIWLFLRR